MKTAKEIDSFIRDAALEYQSKTANGATASTRQENAYRRQQEEYRQAKAYISMPNAQSSIESQLKEVIRKINVIDKRWVEIGEKNYMRDKQWESREKRMQHHHNQYNYRQLVKRKDFLEWLND